MSLPSPAVLTFASVTIISTLTMASSDQTIDVKTSDGHHLARRTPWASSLDQEALAFYADGKLIRSYTVRELVDFERLLPHADSQFQWFESSQLDDAGLRYAISTRDGNSFDFDMTTGAIVQEWHVARMLKWSTWLWTPVVIWLVAGALRRRSA